MEELQKFSQKKIRNYDTFPQSEEEVINRIGDAEAILVSWHTKITEDIIKQCPHLRYVGMCCSLYDDASANVAVNYARRNGITVKGIRDYGDPGVVEFIISELIRLLHGFGPQQWQEMPMELTDRRIGIIGMGTTGKMLAECLLPFGAKLSYYSRSRKEEWEAKGVSFLPLEELLQENEIISIHLPKNTRILKEKEFRQLGSGKILINTSLGLPFEGSAFEDWITSSSNYGIFDGDGRKELDRQVLQYSNVISSEKSAGWSQDTARRLSERVLENIKSLQKV